MVLMLKIGGKTCWAKMRFWYQIVTLCDFLPALKIDLGMSCTCKDMKAENSGNVSVHLSVHFLKGLSLLGSVGGSKLSQVTSCTAHQPSQCKPRVLNPEPSSCECQSLPQESSTYFHTITLQHRKCMTWSWSVMLNLNKSYDPWVKNYGRLSRFSSYKSRREAEESAAFPSSCSSFSNFSAFSSTLFDLQDAV